MNGLFEPGGIFFDLSNSIDRFKLIAAIEADVDASCRNEFSEDPRTHLGASVIGDECRAKAWNAFRWLKFEQFDGRMLRLFNRGHEEEARFVRWLTLAGWEVREFDPVTKKQFRIVGSRGHFGGSLDGMARPPIKFNFPPDFAVLLEFKTHSDKSFAKLKKDGVVKSKPQHYRQMCSYGRAYQFKFGLYCAVNKNNDELYFEIVELDWREADDLFRKAEGIIFSQERPPKIAQTEAFFDCKYCDFAGLCHRGEVPTKNCRSCKHAFPVDDAQWLCAVRNAIIPKEVIPVGCDSYARIA